MEMDPVAMPPLNTLRAFVAAARRESLRQGAEELGVTASAISHQIKALEDWIGAAVFVRSPRRVDLTPLGRTLFEGLRGGFDAIAAAASLARGNARDSVLRISTLPLFASVWLIPRLGRFEAVCARAGIEIAIEFDTSNEVADFRTSKVDVAIRNVPRPTPGLNSRKLLDLRAVPLCSPSIAERLSDPTDLKRATLIHISPRSGGWSRWLDATGNGHIKPRSNLSFDTIPAALEAAVAGRGVMLGADPLIWDAPSASRLTIPFKVKPISAGAYFVEYRQHDRSRRTVRMFVDWLVSEMRSDTKRLSAASRKSTHAPACE
jgi:LysR family glycine cleavage system transcriptional activator